MKIAISARGKGIEELLDGRFGRCEYFQIHDTETDEIKVIENKGLLASGGAGIAAANQLIDEDINVVITGNLGPNAFEIIERADIKAFKSEVETVENILEKYKNNQLDEINIPGRAHNGMR